MLPAWWLGAFPASSVILASYGAALSHLNSAVARDTLKVFGSRIFGPESGLGRLTQAGEWMTAGGGICKAIGVGGGVVGRGGELIVIDDPVKDAEEAHSQGTREKTIEWYQETLRTRLEPGGVILCVMTRWHMDDLGGWLLAQAEKGRGEPWHTLKLPGVARAGDPLGRKVGEALWQKRFPLPELKLAMEEVGPYAASAQYDQEPKPDSTNEFPLGAFEPERFFDAWPRGDGMRVMALDPSLGRTDGAKLGDPSAIVKVCLQGGELWVEADIEVRPTAKIVTDLLAHVQVFKPIGVGVEINTYQELLKDVVMSKAQARGLPPPPVYGILNTVKKELRIRRLEPAIAGMRVRWRNTPGTKLLIRHLQEFPQGDHDDGPDAMEMAQRLLMHLWKGEKL